MSFPKIIQIKETIKELKVLQRRSIPLIAKRINILIVLKKHEHTGISKREVSNLTGINHNTVLKWRNIYAKEGIEAFLKHGRIGFKPSIIKDNEREQLEKILTNPSNGIVGYTELLNWVNTELHKDMKYITLVKYVQRNFNTKIKVARKSHVKKDEKAVEAFKKTSIKSV
ncbi:MAG: helix-turn-helix domain-containing protein [Sphingobacteriales bacterium]|jgi:transposase|nr:helix-turn-helix domain-containing protein [Sphingobacteriales bacterium]